MRQGKRILRFFDVIEGEGALENEERDEIVGMLREELREFIAWTMEELGGEYYLEHADQPVSAWDETATARLVKRLDSADRVLVWERDRYAFFDHPRHPSVYAVMEAEDLEIVHYLEDLACDHYKLEGEGADLSEEDMQDRRRFEESFGVLLASQKRGWMYRLDFCEFCGMIEIWSMGYNPDEIAQYTGEAP
jgi:hypothetical protein